MKKPLTVILFILLGFAGKAQNLVPNYSFEDTIHCPIYAYFQGYVTSWSGSYPAYFNEFCSDPGYGNVPSNTWGYQYAHTGVAYVGVYTFINYTYDTANYNLRDYIQAPLTSTLMAGSKYYVTFYVSLADSCKYACNNIGACFSDSLLNVHTRKVLSYHIPQVANDTSNHLTDKINWMKVSGSFTAQGGEKYVTIGNFVNDKHSDSIFVNSSGSKQHLWTAAYYYIDDVIISPDSNYADSIMGVNELNVTNEKVKVWPNPSNGKFTVEVNSEELRMKKIEVYNMLGEKVYSEPLRPMTQGQGGQAQGDNTINLKDQPEGLYLYRIISEKGEFIGSGKLVIQY